MSELEHVRHPVEGVVRVAELRRIDDEAVADVESVEDLGPAERRRAQPPQVRRDAAHEQGVEQGREVLDRLSVYVQGDELALVAARGFWPIRIGGDPRVEVATLR